MARCHGTFATARSDASIVADRLLHDGNSPFFQTKIDGRLQLHSDATRASSSLHAGITRCDDSILIYLPDLRASVEAHGSTRCVRPTWHLLRHDELLIVQFNQVLEELHEFEALELLEQFVALWVGFPQLHFVRCQRYSYTSSLDSRERELERRHVGHG